MVVIFSRICTATAIPSEAQRSSLFPSMPTPLAVPLAMSSCFRTGTCSMTCIHGDIHCPTKCLPRFCAASLTLLLSFPKQWFTTGCPVSRGKCLSHHTRTPSPSVPDVKECPSYLQTHQELANSLSKERDETPQPRFCLIYNPFMTKKEPCIHKYRKLYKGSFFYPCSSDF